MTAPSTRAPRRQSRAPQAAAPRPWWGDGPSPLSQWPGVTIDIPAIWSRASERWESPDGRYFFDAETADRVCDFFPTFLTHHIGEFVGQPFVLMDYQAKLIVRPLFGWKHASSGLRRFRKIFAFLPKGAGKSPLGSGLGVYCCLCDQEAAAENYCVAADREQARVVHSYAKIMVENSDELNAGAEILRDAIYWASTKSVLKVLSSDASTKHGFRPHLVVFDEIHAQRNRDLYEALKKSMVKRRQPIMLILTHAGDDDEGIGYEEYDYAKKVLSGTSPDDTCLPVIFEASPTDDFTDPDVWRRVNPGHGITVKHDGIAQECHEAIAEPRKRNDFLMFHLNRWVNQAVAWIPIDWWDACASPLPPDEELAEASCAFGIDMAQKIDLAAGVAVFKLPLEHPASDEIEIVSEAADGQLVARTASLNYRLAILPMFWLPEDTLRERVKQDRVPYDLWATARLLRPTPGAIIDSDAIVYYLKDPHGRPDLLTRFPNLKQAQIGYDPAFATEIAARLMALGLTCVEVLQNYKHLSEACQVFEALVKAKRVIHGGNRLLRWNVENVAVKHDDAGRIRMVKPKKAVKRIDGVVAAVIGLSRLMAQAPPPPEPQFQMFVFGGGGRG